MGEDALPMDEASVLARLPAVRRAIEARLGTGAEGLRPGDFVLAQWRPNWGAWELSSQARLRVRRVRRGRVEATADIMGPLPPFHEFMPGFKFIRLPPDIDEKADQYASDAFWLGQGKE